MAKEILDKEYLKEVEAAENDLSEAVSLGLENCTIDAVEFIHGMMTDEERAEHDLRVAVMLEVIDARKRNCITQKELADAIGTKQSVVSHFETGCADTCVKTILKMMKPLGKKLVIVEA